MTTTPRARRAALRCLAAVGLLAAACSGADASGDRVAAEAAGTASWLFSQTSHSGRIEFADGEATRLVMDGVDLHTMAFSDRPERQTDVADTEASVERWEDMFADSAPNAVLVEHRPDGETDSLVVVLSDAVFDPATRTLSYDVDVLADEAHPESVTGLIGDLHDEAPTDFGASSLFIDSSIGWVDKG
ncbi:MAG: hypothetical protein ACK4V6_01540 [Microthrixaceae bacterium]